MSAYSGQPLAAVILAAGLGSRIGSPGGEPPAPKPLMSVGGAPILHRALRALSGAGVRRAVIVVGNQAAEIINNVGRRFAGVDVEFVYSTKYHGTNNAYSLWLARTHLDEDVFLIEGDVAFDVDLLTRLMDAKAPAVIGVAPWRPGMTGTVVALNEQGSVTDVTLIECQTASLDLRQRYKTVNVSLLRREYLAREFVPLLSELIAAGDHRAFYETVLARSVRHGRYYLHAVNLGDLRWCEIDTVADLIAAEYVFDTPGGKMERIEEMHGGYWRYDVTDHRLLHNSYFPPRDMIHALVREFPSALVNYPSGQSTIAQLVSALIGLPTEWLVVANGASELIKAVGRVLDRVVLTVPNFNEYEAVLKRTGNLRHIELTAPDFGLDPAVVERTAVPGTDAFIVTSPNNPTSSLIPKDDLICLTQMLSAGGTRLIVDESFIDFSASGISVSGDLADHSNLVLIKSLSKVYGVGGMRLGYLATADTDFATAIRNELPIWNINGIAESFLRMLPHYASEFAESLQRMRTATAELYDGLKGIDGLVVYRPEANFVFARLPFSFSAKVVSTELFNVYGILIKDCANKGMTDGGRHLRIASRTTLENRSLVTALSRVMGTEK